MTATITPGPTNKTQLPCVACGVAVDVEIVQTEIVNMTNVSMMIISHSGVQTCPGCLTSVVPTLLGAGGIGMVCKQVKQGNLIVPPPGSSNILGGN
jgi:hypothetical protein